MQIVKIFINLLLMFTAGIALISCADDSPFAGEEVTRSQYYFELDKAYRSYIADAESRRLSANLQRKISRSDIQALRGGNNVLLLGNVASTVDIAVARSLVLIEYSDDHIINKLNIESPRRETQVNVDNNTATKVAQLIEKEGLVLVRSACFNNTLYLLMPKNTDSKKLTVLLNKLKEIKAISAVQKFTY